MQAQPVLFKKLTEDVTEEKRRVVLGYQRTRQKLKKMIQIVQVYPRACI